MNLASVVQQDHQFRSPLTPNTLRNYAGSLRRWAALGIVDTSDLSPESAARFVEARLRVNEPASVAADFVAVLAVVAHLERTGRYSPVDRDALRRVAPRLPRRRQFSAQFLTPAALAAFCAQAEPQVAWLVKLACYTGLRASELAALDWQEVDFDRRMLFVRGGKTGARRVPLCAPAVELLREAAKPSGLVFDGASPKALGDRASYVPLACRPASGPRITLTLCRHTRASWWVQAGVPLAKVAKWMGHTIEVCARHYAGLADAYDPAAELGAAG